MIRDNLGEQYQYCSKSSSAENTAQDNVTLANLSAIYLSKKGAGEGETIYKVTWDLKDDGTIFNIRVEIVEPIPDMPDIEPPLIDSVEIAKVTTISITVKVTAHDVEESETTGCTGIEKYYYSKDNGSSWEPIDKSGNVVGISDSTYTFTGLPENTEYSIKVKVVDGAENEAISDTITGKTLERDWVDYAIDINGDGITTNDWRLFYVNDELDTGYANGNFTTTSTARAFLIAADYVESNNTLLDLETAEMYRTADCSGKESAIYDVSWFDLSTSSSTLLSTGKHYSGNKSVTSDIASLFMYDLYYNLYPTRAQLSTRAVSSLLDTEAWRNFADGMYGECAVGGSTLEMWVASWNKRHGMEVEEDGETLYCNKVRSYGYYIGTVSSPTTYSCPVYDTSGYKDTIFFPYTANDAGRASEYFLSSPAMWSGKELVSVCNCGTVEANNYHGLVEGNVGGVRPVVAISLGVTATYNSDTGIWTLSK